MVDDCTATLYLELTRFRVCLCVDDCTATLPRADKVQSLFMCG